MNGLNPAYVESVIRKAKEGKLTTGQAAVKPGMESSVFAPAPSPKEIDFYLSTVD